MTPNWVQELVWVLGGGLVMAALAAIVGGIDVAGEPRIRDPHDVWWHAELPGSRRSFSVFSVLLFRRLRVLMKSKRCAERLVALESAR